MKLTKHFFKSWRIKVISAILLIVLGFMIAAIYTGGSASLFSQVAGLITMPVQKVSSRISDSVSGFFQKYTDSAALYSENMLLKEELTRLREKTADYDRLLHENEQFREVMGMTDNRTDLTMITASVIARDPVSRFYSFTIDRGSLNNVKYLDPVITSDGLVGYVSEVGMNYSKVVTALDISIDIGAYASSTRDIGVVGGEISLAADGLCVMQYLDRESEIKPGDIILTSGGTSSSYKTSIFPRDIIIGTVTKVEANSHGTSLVAIIKPAAEIVTVKNVFVITDFEGRSEE